MLGVLKRRRTALMQLTRLDRLARYGYMARAAVYGLLGYLAFTTANLATQGTQGEFQLLSRIPGGEAVLFVLAAGLLAYGLYKLTSALLDIDRQGTDVKGLAARAGAAIGGVAYLALSWGAFRIALGVGSAGGQETTKDAAATALALPFGSWTLALAGLGFWLAAAAQCRNVVTKRFMKLLAPDAPRFTCTVGRIGLGARTVVFAVIGGSLLRAAWRQNEEEVRDLGGALAIIRDLDLLYLAVAGGLVVFGVYSAIEARYRIVPRIDPLGAGARAFG
ncbi:MAG: DUF1206 domain-containing protein [Rhizobiaceae bacterium]|nr:MAG: DUF1206 domain-containing protein [Rhizobiaceae bacterium]